MRSVSATAAKQNFAAVLDDAQREPVVIRRHDRDIAVLVSPADYARLRGIKIEELRSLSERVSKMAESRGMNEDVLKKLLADEEA
jgi:prevent-host-death family protein